MTLVGLDRYDPDRVGAVGDRAVVLGGSVAGLCAARALADAFDEVVVVERDPLPEGPVARDGAPQTSHPHVLLEGGQAALADFFPGFGEDLLRAGGLLIDASRQLREYQQGGFVTGARERIPSYCASRPLFEHVLRRRVRALDSVVLRDGCRFTGYRTDGAGATVTGVTVRDGSGDEEPIDAGLVVDATGRASRTPDWLAANGYRPPPEDEVTVDLRYSSLRIERPPGDRRIFNVPADPPRTRGAVFVPIEDGQWDVLLSGMHGDEFPADRDEVLAFAGDLPVPEIATLLRERPWVSDGIDHYPFPSSLRRRYEDLDRFPDGLVVAGDAVASFNPVYGQGMSVAALDALALHHALAEGGLDRLGPRYFDAAASVIDTAWQLAAGADFRFPQTTGPKPRGSGLFDWYFSRLLRRAHDDGVVAHTYGRVVGLEEPPTALLRPGILARVLLSLGGE